MKQSRAVLFRASESAQKKGLAQSQLARAQTQRVEIQTRHHLVMEMCTERDACGAQMESFQKITHGHAIVMICRTTTSQRTFRYKSQEEGGKNSEA